MPHDHRPGTAFEAITWRKARASEPNQGCVELARAGDVVGMRDSKNPRGAVLRFDRPGIAALLDGVKRGELDDLTH